MESFEGLLRRTEELLASVNDLDESVREDVYELLNAIDDLHRGGLQQLVAAADVTTLERMANNPRGAWLLEAYELLPRSSATPVQISRRPRPM